MCLCLLFIFYDMHLMWGEMMTDLYSQNYGISISDYCLFQIFWCILILILVVDDDDYDDNNDNV